MTEQPLVTARKLHDMLAKAAGEARQNALRMASVNASQTLVDQLYKVADLCEQQLKAFSPLIDQKLNDASAWEPYFAAGNKMIEFYKEKKQFCNALLSVAKKQTDTAAAKAASTAVQPAANEQMDP